MIFQDNQLNTFKKKNNLKLNFNNVMCFFFVMWAGCNISDQAYVLCPQTNHIQKALITNSAQNKALYFSFLSLHNIIIIGLQTEKAIFADSGGSFA